MSATQSTRALSIREFFAGKGVLVTGATGFLAKAVVEKILRDLPEVRKVYLLIRPRARADGTRVPASERLRDEVLRNSAFSRLREQHGAGFEDWCLARLECVPGDLTHPRLGLDEADFARLTKDIQVVIGSAATVVFDERLDLALQINTLSTERLLEFCSAAQAAYVHISTCYVSGMRKGLIQEKILEPLEAIDAQLPPGAPRPELFEVLKEIEKLESLCKAVSADCETQARKNGWAPDSDEARTALRRALVGAGMRRARSLGWNDTYTYTKWLGEQVIRLKHAQVPVAVVRTSIIESSLREPEPGWIDGLRMADPIIINFGRGRLHDFPASPNVVLDIIPADLVVNAVLAAAAHIGGQAGKLELIQVASSSENPLRLDYLYKTVRNYFEKYPMLDREGRPVRPPAWRFPTLESFKRRISYRYLTPMKALNALVGGPLTLPGTRRLRARLRTAHLALEQLLYYADLYSPYTNLDCRYETARAREIRDALVPAERETFDFDPRRIPWRHYLQDIHIPGLKRNILRMDAPPRAGAGDDHLLDEEAARVVARSAPAIHGVPQTIVELAARGADRFGGKSFLELKRAKGAASKISYAEYFERSAVWARKLQAKLNLARGDRVALWCENSPEWCLAYLAILRAGGTAVPLDRQLPGHEAAGLVRHVEAKAVVVTPAMLAGPGAAFSGGGLPPRLDPLRDLEPFDGEAWPFPGADAASRPTLEPAPESPASIIFTSGTTIAPRGVMLSQVNFVTNALAVAEVLEPLPHDRFVSVLPLHHAFEFTGGFLVPMFGGSAVHHLEGLKDVMETMRRERATVVLGVPRLYQHFADGIRERLEAAGIARKVIVSLMGSVASLAEIAGSEATRKTLFAQVREAFGGELRLFVSGGAALPPELFHFFKRFGIAIAEGYGLTETAPILTVNPLGAPKAGSVGLPLPGVELKVHEPDRAGIGEVWTRGPMVMQGYWRDPEATERVLREGWFRTGDLGRLDEEGYLHLAGRLKDVVVTAAGKKVYPEELEQHYATLPQVKELCVVGVRARRGLGEEAALIVVPERDGEAERQAILDAIENIHAGLPAHQRPARVEFQREELPKTATLKVQRNKVRAAWEAARFEGHVAPKQPEALPAPAADVDARVLQEVRGAIAEIAGVEEASVSPAQKLQLDLGLDSIGRVDLVGKLELRLNVAIPDEWTSKLWTVQDVAEATARALKEGSRATPRMPLAERIWRRGARDAEDWLLDRTYSKAFLQGGMRLTETIFFNAYLGIDAFGLEYVPAAGPFILAANHCSHLDTAAIRAVLGGRSRNLHVMGAKDYFFDTRIKSWFFSTVFNVLPFEREENTLEGLATCRKALDQGRSLLIFPEGSRSRSGQLQSFKPGIGILALELNVPILPVYLQGTFEALPKGSRIPRPAHVVVRFGPAVDFSAVRKQRKEQPEEPPAPSDKKERRRAKIGAMEHYRAAAEQIRDAVERLSRAL